MARNKRNWFALRARSTSFFSVRGTRRPPTAARHRPDFDRLEDRLVLSLSGYHSYATLTTELQGYASTSTYKDIYKLTSIGKSVQDRDLWAVEITGASSTTTAGNPKPEVAVIASMHGNEQVGMEMALKLINNLLTSYKNTKTADYQQIRTLVDNTNIWIVPEMNPDGLEANTRDNAKGYDLNRSFPDLSADFSQSINVLTTPISSLSYPPSDPTTTSLVPEVTAVMNWSAQHNFVVVENLHTGNLLVNYPYDNVQGVDSGGYATSPDDALFQYTTRAYSAHNTPMYTNKKYPDGITNGSAWFAITGGMQDWAYRYLGSNEVTVEMWNGYTPNANKLPGIWSDNRDSMIAYLETAFMGVTGKVTASSGRAVLTSVLVDATGTSVTGSPIEIHNHQVFTDPASGEFYRDLPPGTYSNLTLTVSAPGYASTTVVLTTNGSMIIADPLLKTPGALLKTLPLPSTVTLSAPIVLKPAASPPVKKALAVAPASSSPAPATLEVVTTPTHAAQPVAIAQSIPAAPAASRTSFPTLVIPSSRPRLAAARVRPLLPSLGLA
jgi:carboxypeptidase D